jgi:hypothetical protein
MHTSTMEVGGMALLWRDTVNMPLKRIWNYTFFEDVDDIVHGELWPALRKHLNCRKGERRNGTW